MKSIQKIMLGLSAAAIVFAYPAISYADWHGDKHGDRHGDHHYYRYHDRPRYGLRLSWIPDTFFSLSVGGGRYYYYDGLYYKRFGTDYVIINPPIGAVVRDIPADYRPVIVNGVTYYVDNGIYYVYTRNGYQVVPTPVQVVQPAYVQPAVVTPAVTTINASDDDSFTINIPNERSGYTSVLLKRSGKGFTGPQGEFYSDFPRIAQLKVMYGK